MSELKIQLDNKELVLNNPKLKGERGCNILSEIDAYRKSIKIDGDPDTQEVLKICQKLGIKIDELESNQKPLQDYVLANPDVLAKLYKNTGETKILFTVISSILDYYKVQGIDSDDFTKSDILEVITWLKTEPKNDIPDFLGAMTPLGVSQK